MHKAVLTLNLNSVIIDLDLKEVPPFKKGDTIKLSNQAGMGDTWVKIMSNPYSTRIGRWSIDVEETYPVHYTVGV